MGFKFTIGKKIGAGFSVLIVCTIITFILTYTTVAESKKTTDEVVSNVTPSVGSLEDFNLELQKSHNLITKWKHITTGSQVAFKDSLRNLIKYNIPRIKAELNQLKLHWDDDSRLRLDTIFLATDDILTYYKVEIMERFSDFDSYKDVENDANGNEALEEIDKKIDNIFEKLNYEIKKQKLQASIATKEMVYSFNFLQFAVQWLGVALVLGGILIAFFTVRTIVKPVSKLKGQLQFMSKGILPKERIKGSNDEIGDMNVALIELVESMEQTTEFARQVGAGNFESVYKPLSEHDTLGYALLGMRTDLRESERVLEQKVIERTEQVVKQKEEIESKSAELETLYNHVTDSIRYAKRIQEAILPPESMVRKLLPGSFILYKPKDIVSGDFYWLDEKEGVIFFAAVDCTGHGVPGAFMSIVGYNLLKELITLPGPHTPASLMDGMKRGVSATLHHGQSEGSNAKDGMDMSMCSINYKKMELNFAGAFNPLYIIRGGELIQYKADKFPVGLQVGTENQQYTNHTIQLQKGDSIYVFSDGYADQFGGPKGKKFMASHFRELLIKSSELDINKQKDFLNSTIEDWRGVLEQVDDILIIGVKV